MPRAKHVPRRSLSKNRSELLLDQLEPGVVSLTALFAAARIDVIQDPERTLKKLEAHLNLYCLQREVDARKGGYDAAVREFAKRR